MKGTVSIFILFGGGQRKVANLFFHQVDQIKSYRGVSTTGGSQIARSSDSEGFQGLFFLNKGKVMIQTIPGRGGKQPTL